MSMERYDMHFSLGGASGETGAAGEADPVEAHVSLASGEDDTFARTALDMSEQTCFLHALVPDQAQDPHSPGPPVAMLPPAAARRARRPAGRSLT
jgi:hypothetical protein